MATFQEFLADGGNSSSDTPEDRRTIRDDLHAGYVRDRLIEARTHLADKKREAALLHDHIERWLAGEEKSLNETIEFRTSQLRQYFDGLKADGKLRKGMKSYNLPLGGSIGERKAAVQYDRNEAELLVWAKTVGLIVTTEKADWTAIKARIAPEREAVGSPVVDTVSGEVIVAVRVKQPESNQFFAD